MDPINWISKCRAAQDPLDPEARHAHKISGIKCPESGQLVFSKDVEANQYVIRLRQYHAHGD